MTTGSEEPSGGAPATNPSSASAAIVPPTAQAPPHPVPSPPIQYDPTHAPLASAPSPAPSPSRARTSFLGRRPSLAPFLNRLNWRPPTHQHERLPAANSPTGDRGPGAGEPALKRPRILIPFGVILSGFMLALACLVAPLSWYFTNSAGVSTSFQFANQLQTALLDHAVSSIVVHLDAAERLTGLQQRNWRSGNFQLSNKTLVMRQLFDRLKYNQDLIVTQSFTTYLGELWGYYTSLSGTPPQRIYKRWETIGLNYTEYEIDANDRVLRVSATNTNYNASSGDWITIVNKTDPTSMAWTPVYVWQNVAWITQSRPIFNPSGTHIGVASSDLELTFLRSLLDARVKAVTRPTTMYAFEAASEYIIGTSAASLDMFVRQGASKQAVMPKTMKQVGETDLLIRTIREKLLVDRGRGLRALGNTTETISSVGHSVNGTVSTAMSNWIVSTQTIQWNSIHWVILQIMNEEEVLREINSGSYQAAGATAGLLIGCVLVAGFFSLAFSRSLDKVTRHLNKITESDFMSLDPSDFDVSPISAAGAAGGSRGGGSGVALQDLSMCLDIRRIQEAFASMVRSFVRAAQEHRSLRTMSRPGTMGGGGGQGNRMTGSGSGTTTTMSLTSPTRGSATIQATSTLGNDD